MIRKQLPAFSIVDLFTGLVINVTSLIRTTPLCTSHPPMEEPSLMTIEKEKQISRREFLDTSVKATAALAVAGSFPTLIQGCSQSADADFDVLIKNGTIYDGTLNNPYVADIGIKGETISAVGKLSGNACKNHRCHGKNCYPRFHRCPHPL